MWSLHCWREGLTIVQIMEADRYVCSRGSISEYPWSNIVSLGGLRQEEICDEQGEGGVRWPMKSPAGHCFLARTCLLLKGAVACDKNSGVFWFAKSKGETKDR